MKFYTYWSNRILLSANTFAKFCVYVRIFACFVSNQNFSVLYLFVFFSSQILSVFCFRPEFSLHIGDLSSDVDDYTLYCAFAKNYRSVRGAKGVSREQLCQVVTAVNLKYCPLSSGSCYFCTPSLETVCCLLFIFLFFYSVLLKNTHIVRL